MIRTFLLKNLVFSIMAAPWDQHHVIQCNFPACRLSQRSLKNDLKPTKTSKNLPLAINTVEKNLKTRRMWLSSSHFRSAIKSWMNWSGMWRVRENRAETPYRLRSSLAPGHAHVLCVPPVFLAASLLPQDGEGFSAYCHYSQRSCLRPGCSVAESHAEGGVADAIRQKEPQPGMLPPVTHNSTERHVVLQSWKKQHTTATR